MKAVGQGDELGQGQRLASTTGIDSRGSQGLLGRIWRAGQLGERTTKALATLGEGSVNDPEHPFATRLA
jgi:hypothetical protein